MEVNVVSIVMAILCISLVFTALYWGRHDRHHHAIGAGIERARDVMPMLAGHAHDQRQLGRLAVAHDLTDGIEPKTGMLHVEHGEVGAGRLEDLADPGRRELEQERPDLGPAGADQGSQILRWHRVSPFLCRC